MATADRVKETSTTTGTGDFTLLGAVSQFQAFGDAFSPPATVSYAIVGQTGTEWEVGEGTLADATTLERTTVHASSNSGNAVNFSAGTKDVFATFSAADIDAINTAISGKAATSHTHASGDITGLATSATTDTTNASNISSGTLADARLSSNVPLKDGANDFSAAQEISVNGAASTPALKIDGTIFSGGTGTTTTPQLLVEPTGTTSSSWSTSGTAFGVNSASGFSGRLMDLKANNTSQFYVTSGGAINLTSNIVCGGNLSLTAATSSIALGSGGDVRLEREAAAILQMGADAASPITQTFKGADARAGTDTNTVGGILTIAAGRGTGTAAGGELRLQTSEPTSSGSNAGTLTTRLTISGTAITAALPIVTQGYTVAGLAAITPLVAGMRAHVTDATGPTFMATLVGGGSVVAPAFYDGTNWICA